MCQVTGTLQGSRTAQTIGLVTLIEFPPRRKSQSSCVTIRMFIKMKAITPSLPLMETTATPEEIRRFGLEEGDVVITKDSEDWRDIAVPALVSETSPELVCGYHLALVRPRKKMLLGEYLLRVFQSTRLISSFGYLRVE